MRLQIDMSNNLTAPTPTAANASAVAPLKIVRNLSLKRMKGSSNSHEKVRPDLEQGKRGGRR